MLKAGHNTTSTHRMRGDTGDKGIDRTRIVRMQRTDPSRVSKESLLRPCFKLWSRQRPCGFWRVWFFMWWIKAGPHRYWTTLILWVGRGGRYITTKKNVTGRELSVAVLSRPGILGHSTKRMNSRMRSCHLYLLRRPTKSELTRLFFKPVCMYTRTGNRNDSLEW